MQQFEVGDIVRIEHVDTLVHKGVLISAKEYFGIEVPGCAFMDLTSDACILTSLVKFFNGLTRFRITGYKYDEKNNARYYTGDLVDDNIQVIDMVETWLR